MNKSDEITTLRFYGGVEGDRIELGKAYEVQNENAINGCSLLFVENRG